MAEYRYRKKTDTSKGRVVVRVANRITSMVFREEGKVPRRSNFTKGIRMGNTRPGWPRR